MCRKGWKMKETKSCLAKQKQKLDGKQYLNFEMRTTAKHRLVQMTGTCGWRITDARHYQLWF